MRPPAAIALPTMGHEAERSAGIPSAGDATSLRFEAVELMSAVNTGWLRWVEAVARRRDNASWPRMRLLSLVSVYGAKPMSELAEVSGLTARNVTSIVDILERDGFVRRVPDAKDRRVTRIEPTEEGRRHALSSYRPMYEEIASLFGNLPDEELRELTRSLRGLYTAMAALNIRVDTLPLLSGPLDLRP